ncbi:MAG: glutamine--fructose-6-phosphate transaminase (isomerizing) [Clostridiales bacterium]|jgi:glucosamine--fructose-6-phosphate aminotransferase (isomerizing)|nr:glutamine--fructose-6-phosphate transaminase (isomerizing) [Clostridiales bacterium]
MCGIVGYIGSSQAAPLLIDSLKRLEYRGYDSAGISVFNQGVLNTVKCKGRISVLEEKMSSQDLSGLAGIGHTRWATHGEPSDVNSHPHTSPSGRISVVHNGIIENYQALRAYLISKGYTFTSETDTEVIPHLIDYYYKGSITEAVSKAVSKMEGSYALGVLARDEPDKIVAVRKDSPLVIGTSDKGNFLASDVSAFLPYSRLVYYSDDNELAVIRGDSIEFLSAEGDPIPKTPVEITWSVDAAEKGGYEHFMLKEIHEQPKAIRDTMASRIVAGSPVAFESLKLSEDGIKSVEKIFIVACGTAYHAGVVGRTIIEKMTGIPVETDIASEFRYRDPIIPKNALMIVISQSGETADTLAAMREAKRKGASILAITNVVGSSVAREADNVIHTWAGPEIAVASTKAYVTQIIAILAFGLYLAQIRGSMSEEEIESVKGEMLNLPEKAEAVLSQKETLQKFAAQTYNHRDMFYLGRGLDYALAMEGALKLKEISYIHTESYAGGELKHGTIALIESGTVVIALATQESLREKMISNIKEVTTRGANVLGFTINKQGENFSDDGVASVVTATFSIPWTQPLLVPVLAVIPLQLFAYYVAVLRGCDVDKPRNLAKSVTVE